MPIANIEELITAINDSQNMDSCDSDESYTYNATNIDSLLKGGFLCSERY